MAKKAGVYIIKGTKGTRVGQSKDVPRRLPEVVRKLRPRLGKVTEVGFLPVAGPEKRRSIEQAIIDEVRPSLNKIRA